MADHSKAQDHHRMAQLLLAQSHRHTDTGVPRDEELGTIFLTTAQVHATLAVADQLRELTKWVHEVGDQLDTIPRRGGAA